MSNCYNCGTSFTLKDEEVKCDSCGAIANFPCHTCHKWFSISKDDGGKVDECRTCKFFICPYCGICGQDCDRETWAWEIREIIPSITTEQMKKLLDYIEEVKITLVQKTCPRHVPISYGKSRIKTFLAKTKGYKVKNSFDMEKFKEKITKVTATVIGATFTAEQLRSMGSYGQEERDALNYLVCMGKLEKVKLKKRIGDKEVEYYIYRRCEKESCPYHDAKNLLMKRCHGCNEKFPLDTISHCLRKNGIKKGQPFPMSVCLNNKDVCNLPRNHFKKEGKDGGDKL